MSEDPKEIRNEQTDEIDLIEVFKKIWAQRKIVYKSVAVFFVIGLVIVFCSPKEYKADVTLLAESAQSGGSMSGLLQQFGGLSGLGVNQDGDIINPELYPDIIKSTPFLFEVLNQKVYDSKVGLTLRVYDILDKHTRPSFGNVLIGYTIGLPGKIIGIFSGNRDKKSDLPIIGRNGVIQLTKKQMGIAGGLSKRIKVKQAKSTNTVTISVEMQDAVASAQLVDSVVKSLTNYIIDYRTQKAKNDLNFVAARCAEAESKYLQAQRALASRQDQSRNIILASAKIDEQRLQAEYSLAFSLYNTLAQQLEQAKMKVQENTPVFKVIDPAKVPLQKEKPKSKLVLIAMIFFGGFIGIGTIIGQILLIKINKK